MTRPDDLDDASAAPIRPGEAAPTETVTADGGSAAALGVVRLVRELNLETQRYVEEVAHAVGLHRSDVAAIGVLVDAPRLDRVVGPGDLVGDLGLSAAAVSALVARLERVGHVTRRPHAADRRRVVLGLTEDARETSRTMFAPLSSRMHDALQAYSPAELDVAARVLADLTDAARRSADETPPDVPRRVGGGPVTVSDDDAHPVRGSDGRSPY